MSMRAGWVLVLACQLGLFSVSANAAETYTVDAVHSSVMFRIKHMNASYAWGRFNNLAGSFTLDAADVTQSALDFTVDAESVDTANAKRDEHLKGPDFFNVKQFPEIRFKSTSVKKAAEGYEVTGDLTLHGVTKPVVAKVNLSGTGKSQDGSAIAGLEASFQFKRSEFGLTNLVGPLADDVWVVVSIEGAKK